MGNPIVRSLLQKDFKIEVDPNWSLPEMAENVIQDVGKHIAGRKELRALLKMLPKGKSPVEEQHKYITNRYGKIDKSDPRITLAFMENFVSEAASLERQAIAHGVARIKDITADELVMLTDHFVPSAADKLWYRWFKELVIPLETMDEAAKIDTKNILQKLMNQYDYTAIIDGRRLSWARAFPFEIQELIEALKRLESKLKDKHIKTYLRSLIRAYGCDRTEDLEKRWTDVDYAWVEIPKDCRVFPVHGMESGYEHPYGVSPEWRVMVRSDFARKEIEEISDAAPMEVNFLGAEVESFKEKLDHIDIGVFHTAIWAGVPMNFRLAGQAVPNRQNVLARGGKIFMDLDSHRQVIELYKELLGKYTSEPVAKALSEHIGILAIMENTAGHEVSHPAGRTEEIDRKLGDSLKLLEEAKATMCGNLINESRSEGNRLEIAAETIARICRFFSKARLEDPAVQQYVWENMVACSTMYRAGVIKVASGRIEVDLEKAKSRNWFIELEKFVRDVFTAYKNGDGDDLQRMHRELCDKDEGIIAEVIALVNKE